jgi:hypothetical protein
MQAVREACFFNKIQLLTKSTLNFRGQTSMINLVLF